MSATEDLPLEPWNEEWQRHPDFCWTHGVLEPMTPTTFCVCGECFHVFASAEELLNEARAFTPDITDADKVWCCPHCAHDF